MASTSTNKGSENGWCQQWLRNGESRNNLQSQRSAYRYQTPIPSFPAAITCQPSTLISTLIGDFLCPHHMSLAVFDIHCLVNYHPHCRSLSQAGQWQWSKSSSSVSINVGNQAHILLRRGGAWGGRMSDGGVVERSESSSSANVNVGNQGPYPSKEGRGTGSNSCTLCQKKIKKRT